MAHLAFGSVFARLDNVSGQARSQQRARIHLREGLYKRGTALDRARFPGRKCEMSWEGGPTKLMVICWISALISRFPAYGATSTVNPGHETRPRVQYGVASWFGDRE